MENPTGEMPTTMRFGDAVRWATHTLQGSSPIPERDRRNMSIVANMAGQHHDEREAQLLRLLLAALKHKDEDSCKFLAYITRQDSAKEFQAIDAWGYMYSKRTHKPFPEEAMSALQTQFA